MRRNRPRTIPFLNYSYDPEIETTLRKLKKRKLASKESHTAPAPIRIMADQLFGNMGRPTPAHSTASCIAKPEIDAKNFELRMHLIQFIERNQFGRSASENPQDHLSDFIEKCDTILIGGVSVQFER